MISDIASVDVLHTSTDGVWNGMAIGIAVNSAAYGTLRKFNTLRDTSGPGIVLAVVAAGATYGAIVDLMVGNERSWINLWRR